MTISAKVVLCSQSVEKGAPPIWTLQLRYPRFIHAELMTHRAFSRNASSSRAIPVRKLMADISENPAMPVHWGKNQKGMQADVELDEEGIRQARFAWREACESALIQAEKLERMGLHKQIVNRVLEPFSHINVVLTGTDFDNFFLLRDHPDAQPEIRALAKKMREAMTDVYWDGKINLVQPGEWHYPYLRISEYEYAHQIKVKLSAARCARVSYLEHDGSIPTTGKDIELYDRLIEAKPAHASPIEHQAMAMSSEYKGERFGGEFPRYANFTGWQSHRNMLEKEGVL